MIQLSRWCDRTLIESPIYYCLVLSEEAYYKECENLEIPRFEQGSWLSSKTSHATISYWTSPKGQLIAIIAVNGETAAKKTPIQVAGLLVHEAVHLFEHYCQTVGETKPSSEFSAYSIQWLAQELMEQYLVQQQHAPA